MNGSTRTACFGLLLCATACSGGSSAYSTSPTGSTPTGSTPVATSSITANTSNQFTPNSIIVAVGTSVSYTFQSVGHNVTFNAVAGAPPSILGTNMNTTIAVTFATAGTFPYQCTIHPGMTGTVTVQ